MYKLNKRGFSLVELMVVVAIMGVLASVAIPAYNEYRRSAKKNAYKSDLISLHKGWLAFGVELDSYCERETSPGVASIINTGMASLGSSKLYGTDSVQACKDCGTHDGTSCVGVWTQQPALPGGTDCTTLNATTPGAGDTCNCADDGSAVARKGPGKHNFIGFGAENCPDINTVEANLNYRGDVSGRTPLETDCDLNVTTYEMGVFGHVSGDQYFGFRINNQGISAETDGLDDTLAASEVCS